MGATGSARQRGGLGRQHPQWHVLRALRRSGHLGRYRQDVTQSIRSIPISLPMNRDSQTRMTNDEIRRNDQIRMTKPATAELSNWTFGLRISFVIGHSSFNDSYSNPLHGLKAR